MPLILLCGYPSSGKTYRAKQIVAYLEQKLQDPTTSGPANGPSDDTQSAVKELSKLNLKAVSSTPTELGVPSEDAISETLAKNRLQTPSTTSSPPTSIPAQPQNKSNRSTSSAQPSRKIHYISDHTLDIPRSSYLTAKQEKDARGALYSAVKRALSRNDIVVLDSGNYIKGWRYQLYCEAKNMPTASCVIHVGVPGDKCREINKTRLQQLQLPTPTTREDDNAADPDPAGTSGNKPTQPVQPQHALNGSAEQDPYDETAFEELLMRFEEPNPMTRWDTPLYTVPWDDATPPLDQLWSEVIQGIGKDGKAKVIRPNQATVLTPASAPSHLYNLERTTQAVIAAIQAHQQQQGGAAEGDTVGIPVEAAQSGGSGEATTVELTLPAVPLTFPHLQRLRRQFIALHRQQMGGLGMGGVGGGHGAGGMGLSPERVAELFVGFLSERFAE